MKQEASMGSLSRFFSLRRELVLAIGVALLALLIVVMVIVPQISASFSLQAEIAKARQESVALQRKSQLLQEASATPLLIQEGDINAALPDHKPLTELLTTLSGVAQTAGVGVTRVNLNPGLISTQSAQATTVAPVSSSSIPGVDIMKIEISVEGSFEQINNFLLAVDRMSPLVIVNVFELREAGGETDTSVFDATLTLDTYFYTNSVAATIGQELPPMDETSLAALQQLATFTRSNTSLPTEIVGGGVNDVFGLTPSQLQDVLENQGSTIPSPTPLPSLTPEPTPVVTPPVTPIQTPVQ